MEHWITKQTVPRSQGMLEAVLPTHTEACNPITRCSIKSRKHLSILDNFNGSALSFDLTNEYIMALMIESSYVRLGRLLTTKTFYGWWQLAERHISFYCQWRQHFSKHWLKFNHSNKPPFPFNFSHNMSHNNPFSCSHFLVISHWASPGYVGECIHGLTTAPGWGPLSPESVRKTKQKGKKA